MPASVIPKEAMGIFLPRHWLKGCVCTKDTYSIKVGKKADKKEEKKGNCIAASTPASDCISASTHCIFVTEPMRLRCFIRASTPLWREHKTVLYSYGKNRWGQDCTRATWRCEPSKEQCEQVRSTFIERQLIKFKKKKKAMKASSKHLFFKTTVLEKTSAVYINVVF